MLISCSMELLALLLLLLCVVAGAWKISLSKKRPTGMAEARGALPIVGHLHLLSHHNRPLARVLGTMADKYGPVFSLRLGHHWLLALSSWETAKSFLSTHDQIFATRPSIAAGKYMGYDSAVFALAPYGKYWRDARKMATLELLSSHRLEKLRHVRESELEFLVGDLRSLCACAGHAVSVTLSELLENMTFNVMLRLITGKRFSATEFRESSSHAWRIKHAIEKATYLSGVFVLSDAIPWLEWIDFQGHLSSMKHTAQELDSVLDSWLQEHVTNILGGPADFIDVMLSTLPEGVMMSGHSRDTVVKATALILILTGTESTAITVTWALSLLLNNPGAVKAVVEEMDREVGKERWVQLDDVKRLKYLQAVVKETLRLYPPGPLTGLREAMEDCFVDGCHVPKGTRVVVNLWKLQRDPRVWPDPTEFRPERFFTTHADVDLKGQHFEFIPFSSGRRSCPGMALGLQVVHFTLARLLQGFNIATPGGVPVDMSEGPGIALPKAKPLQVLINPRVATELYKPT